MWQKIIVGALVAVALWYLAKRIYRSAVKGHDGACADCPPGQLKSPARNNSD
jgi:hypothetical protein